MLQYCSALHRLKYAVELMPTCQSGPQLPGLHQKRKVPAASQLTISLWVTQLCNVEDWKLVPLHSQGKHIQSCHT